MEIKYGYMERINGYTKKGEKTLDRKFFKEDFRKKEEEIQK